MHIGLLLSMLVAAALWATVHFVALPRVEQWQDVPVRRAGAKVVLECVRLFAFVAFLTYLGVIVVVKALSVNAAWLIDLSERAHAVHARLERFDTVWTLLLVAGLAVAFTYAAARRARNAEAGAEDDYLRGEWAKIDALREAGHLPDLPPTPAMIEIEAMIATCEAALPRDENGDIAEIPPSIADELRPLLRAYYQRDTARRITPRPPQPPVEKPRTFAGTLLDQFGAVATSRGTIAAGVGARRVMHIGVVVFLCLSMITVTADRVGAAALNGEAVALSQVAVARQHDEAAKEVAGVLPQPTLASPRPLTSYETKAAHFTAHAFANSLERSRALAPFHAPPAAEIADLHAAQVRNGILNYLEPETRGALSSVASLDEFARGTAARIDRGGDVASDPIARRAERQFSEKLARVPQAESESFLKRFLQSYTRPSSVEQIRAALTGQAFSAIVDGAAGTGPADVVNEVRYALTEGGGESLGAYIDSSFDRFTTMSAHDGMRAAVQRFAEPGSNVDLYGRGLLGDLRDRYASLGGWDRLVTETRAHPPAALAREAQIPAWATRAPPKGRSEWATTFSDIAPAGLGDDLRSPRNAIDVARRSAALADHGASLPAIPRVSDPVPPNVARELANVAASDAGAALERGGAKAVSNEALSLASGLLRSRSYSLLSGFSRIGGVLIGAPPADVSQLNCNAIDWTVRADQVTLELSGPNCPWSATPIDRGLAAAALAYAADGRPVATTMVSSAPLLDGLSVHVHPALIDTPIGRETTKIDMFIDTYYRHGSAIDPQYTALADVVQDQISLYHVALGVRERAIVEHRSDLSPSATANINGEARSIEVGIKDADVTTALERRGKSATGESRQSILRVKSAYFDSDLVDMVEPCEASSSDGASYRSCVADALKTADYGNTKKLNSWLKAQIVSANLESGVRELPYDASQSLRLSDDAVPTQNGVGPFRFEIHVTFFTNPAFAKSEAEVLQQDEHPYDFPTIEPNIRERIVAVAGTHADVDATLHRMAAFTRTQRIFRLALAGSLGPAFPTNRLVALARDLAASPLPHKRTIRWLATPEAYVTEARKTADALAKAANAASQVNEAPARLAARMAIGLNACIAERRYVFETTHYLFAANGCDDATYATDVAALAQCSLDICSLIGDGYDFLRIVHLRNDLNVSQDDLDRYDQDLLPS